VKYAVSGCAGAAADVRSNQNPNLKMKLFIVAALIACAYAAGSSDYDAKVLRHDASVDVNGYQFGFETSNQIKHDSQGTLKNAGSKNEAFEVTGQYSFVAPDGTPYTVNYRADENGYQPDNLPVGPPIPEAIARSLKLLPKLTEYFRK